MSQQTKTPLLIVKNVKTYYPVKTGFMNLQELCTSS